MKVICVVSAKGGVGKSTIAVNLACAAQDDQQRVAILDIDPQGSSILWGGITGKASWRPSSTSGKGN